MSSLPLLVVALVLCATPGAQDAADPDAADLPARAADDEEPPRTEVAVLGMIHSGHVDSERWGLDRVRATIAAYGPDAILVEIPPDRFAAAWTQVAAGEPVTEERVRVFPEYAGDCVLHLAHAAGIEVVPCAGWTQDLADLRRERMEEFEEGAQWTDERADYEERLEAVRARWSDDPTETDDPRAIHSARYDARTKDELSIYDEVLNDFIGPGGWSNVNAAHWALIERAIDERPGQRLLVTFGAGHKYVFLERLSGRADVAVLDVRPFLPPPAGAGAPPGAEVNMEERLAREVRDLHVFFDDWLAGRLEDPAFTRLERALAPDFEIVGPDGRSTGRAALLEALRAARGSEPADPEAFWIRTDAVRARPAGEDLWIVTYEEWQRRSGEERGRLSTALLEPAEPSQEVPTGVRWHHVHETWLP